MAAPEKRERHILVVSQRDDAASTVNAAKKLGLGAEVAPTIAAARAHLARHEPDSVMVDLATHASEALDLCSQLAEERPDVPVLVTAREPGVDEAVAALRAQAFDFLSKPVVEDVLVSALERALARRSLTQQLRRIRDGVNISEPTAHPDDLIGQSDAMRDVLDLLSRVASRDTSVLITGESGTGKELAARALHARSKRRDGPFVAINCAALPEPLLESELFGHAKGAFTDARNSRSGLFNKASGGTLFLDEIGEMPLATQPKLLRALQERKVRPVGSDHEVPIDVRVVTATNRDLETEVEARRFREDLFYRINVVHLELPALRSRGNDILLLATHFLARFAKDAGQAPLGISRGAAERLLAYHWPGNVRGLQNCMERAVALARYDEITVDDLPEKIRNHEKKYVVVATDDPSELLPMDEVERRYILRVLEAVKGNKKSAAKVLGFDRATLYRKLARYGLGESVPTAEGASGD